MLKRRVPIILFALIVFGFFLKSVINFGSPADPADLLNPKQDFCAYDFSMRMNEIDCLKSGINPYLVWNREVDHDRYYPHEGDELRTASRNQPINAYTPWEYSYLYPLSLIKDRILRWRLYYGFLLACLSLLVICAFRFGYMIRRDLYDGIFCFTCPLLLVPAIRCDVFSGNFAVIITVSLFLMAICLNKHYDVLAGMCWACAMIKPQLSLLFGVPLLLGGRFKTIFVAASICTVASIPPALLCNTSIVDLIVQAPKASAHGFTNCALMPTWVSGWLNESLGLPMPAIIWISAFFGVVLCIVLSALIKDERNWVVKFAPCAILSVSWTYQLLHSHCIAALAIVVMAGGIVSSDTWRTKMFYVISLLLFAKAGCAVSLFVERLLTFAGIASGGIWGDIIRQSCSVASVVVLILWCKKIGIKSGAKFMKDS